MIPFSFTKMKTFHQCAYKFYRLYVATGDQRVKESPSAAMTYGNKVHDALEAALVRNRPLSKKFSHAQWALDYVRTHTGLKITEKFMSVDRQCRPCSGRDPDKFNTLKADVINLRAADADLFDYKTGAHSSDLTQLQDGAAVVMMYFPTVVKVNASLLFTETENLIEDGVFHREEIMDYINPWYDTDSDVRATAALNKWDANPSGLCGYCPVAECGYHPSQSDAAGKQGGAA